MNNPTQRSPLPPFNFSSSNLPRNFHNIILTIVIIALSILALFYLNNSQFITIDRDAVVMRAMPSTQGSKLTDLPKGSKVTLLKEDKDWILVRYQGKLEGWVPQWLLKQTDLPSDQDLTAEINQTIALYKEQDQKSTVIGQLNPGQFIPINYQSLSWGQVSYQGKLGYIETDKVIIRSRTLVEADLREEQKIKDQERAKQKERDQLKDQAIMRRDNEYLLEQPSPDSPAIYLTEFSQEFKILDRVELDQGHDYYFVEDKNGLKGYVNQFAISEPIYSLDHHKTRPMESLSEATIMIDPGHGGEDPGTLSIDGKFKEKDYTLPTALKIKETLEALGAEVILTRDSDEFLDLQERAQLSSQAEVDFFVSIHFDASYDPTWEGHTTYFYHPDDQQLAYSVHQALKTLPLEDTGVMFGNYQVIRENHQPSLLLELGYMTHPEDLKKITDPKYHQQIADALADGLVNYLKQVKAE